MPSPPHALPVTDAAELPTPIAAWHALLLTLLLTLAPSVLLSVIAAGFGRLTGTSLSDAQQIVSGRPVVLAIVTVISAMLPLWLVRQRVPRPSWSIAYGLRPVPWRALVIAALTGVALQFPLSEVSNLMELVLPVSLEQKQAIAKLMRIDSIARALEVTLAVVIAAPVCEELVFRGVLLRGMRRVHGVTIALLSSSLLFGAAHIGLVTSVLPASLAGLAFGAVTLRKGSILPAIAMHAGVNCVPLLLPASRVTIVGFNTLQDGVYHVPLAWLLPSCVIAAGGIWWLNRSGVRA